MRALLIGGARSGKSALAARWAADRSKTVCVLATGTESDPEMTARIAAHRRERPAHWLVREEPVRLGAALRETATAAGAPDDGSLRSGSVETSGSRPLILVDCLTLWISNCLWRAGSSRPDEALWQRERAEFLDAVASCPAELIMVTNEVGTGIVPGNAASRIFRDEQGWLNQAVAAACHEVFLITAGLALCLKPGQASQPAPPR